ncbi:MAG TPA: lysophospholipid acyltransferase family protein [Thermodesulfobacteriota bacterium]|nr:lysophospholipid acyltransferase family protein [Thermodesulfobacteriota bacterium]
MTPRTALVAAVVPLVTVVLAVVTIGLLLIPGTRPFIERTIVPFWAAVVVRSAGVRYRVEGRERIPEGPVVFVANHRSHLDIPVLCLALGRPLRFVAKRELVRIPFFGWALFLLGHITVDRRNPEQARLALERAAGRVRGGLSVLFFAEGTRGTPELIARSRLAPLKKGGIVLALTAGVPLVPVAIAGTERILPKGSLAVRPGEVRVRIGPPLDTRGLTLADRDRVAGALHAWLYAALAPEGEPARVAAR